MISQYSEDSILSEIENKRRLVPNGYKLIENPEYELEGKGAEIFSPYRTNDMPMFWDEVRGCAGYKIDKWPDYLFAKKITVFEEMRQLTECETKLNFSSIGKLLNVKEITV